MGRHEDVQYQVNDEDCTEVDEQKKSGLDLFYFGGVYAIVKVVREPRSSTTTISTSDLTSCYTLGDETE
jgi:hypothetical protein